MQKFSLPVQPNLDVLEKNDCQIRIQRPKNIESDHTHQLCISKTFSVMQCYCKKPGHFSKVWFKKLVNSVTENPSSNRETDY